ncbi:patatin-like phospholipase family protein [Poseidonocella sp. HB161398]|uniref:patatin-like phospholipase family protein n=1 Tax=Poseidonocella sp. HB161398 TaxID=2320855 RepID=UPI0011080E7D|nr:patatin-like phospholipase family protein [Poseidonocella sp. HB161398]
MAAAPVPVGLALGMGGARGFCHVGVFRALDELGISVDRVSGSSMGALVGAAWAAGRLDALEDWARSLTRTKFLGYIDLRLSGGGFVAGNEIPRLLDELGIPLAIEELGCPFGAVATDLQTGREVWFSRGEIRPAIRASVSIPGVLTPVHHGGKWLVDGALSDPVPVMGCRALGSGPVLAVDPNGFGPAGFWTPPAPSAGLTGPLMAHLRAGSQAVGLGSWLAAPEPAPPAAVPPHYMDVIWASVDIVSSAVMRMRLAASPPDLMLEVPLRDLSILEFEKAAEAIEAGHRAVMASADEIGALAGL